MNNPVFVALDTTSVASAQEWARKLTGHVGGLKLGLEFFTACGSDGVRQVVEAGLPLFLDLKFHDIPNTVAGAMRGIADLAPAYTTIHAGGGLAMMKAASNQAAENAAKTGKRTKVLAVTILTSLDQDAMTAIGYQGSVADQVKRMGLLAKEAGVDGLVCSPHEVSMLRAELGADIELVVPGIRPQWAAAGDQARIMTPAQAMAQGASHLVIGRPITGAADPIEAAKLIQAELS